MKKELEASLKSYAIQKDGGVEKNLDMYIKNNGGINVESYSNLMVSSYLVNHFTSETESYLGVQKGSQLPENATTGRIFQFMNRLTTWDGFLGFLGLEKLQGAALAAKRSQEFSENLARAPHVAGFIKMCLIALFPTLVFLIVAGYWRVLWYWFMIYFSVLLWAPIWTLLYHLVVSISLSSEMLSAFGSLNDGISLYSANLISSRIYHLYEVYSWLQLLTGTLFTGALLYFLRPGLNDTERDSAPEFVESAGDVAAKGSKVASMAGGVL